MQLQLFVTLLKISFNTKIIYALLIEFYVKVAFADPLSNELYNLQGIRYRLLIVNINPKSSLILSRGSA